MKARQLEGNSKGGQATKENKFIPNSDKTSHTTSTDKELADIAGVSKYAIQGTRKILNEGTEEQKQRVREGGKGNN